MSMRHQVHVDGLSHKVNITLTIVALIVLLMILLKVHIKMRKVNSTKIIRLKIRYYFQMLKKIRIKKKKKEMMMMIII